MYKFHYVPYNNTEKAIVNVWIQVYNVCMDVAVECAIKCMTLQSYEHLSVWVLVCMGPCESVECEMKIDIIMIFTFWVYARC